MEPFHVTSMAEFLKCPRRVALNREINPESDAMRRGTACHEIVPVYYMEGEKAARAKMDEVCMALPIPVVTEVRSIMETFFAKPPELPEEHLGRWWECKMEVLDDKITGTPDLWWVDTDATLHIIDWKTDAQPGMQGPPSESMQLMTYAAELANIPDTFDIERARIGFHYLRFGYTTWEEVDYLQLAAHYQKVKAVYKEMDACRTSGVWPARFGQRCTWCDWGGKCEVYQAALQIGAPEAPNSASDCAEMKRRANILNKECARLDALSRDWVELNGPVEDQGETLAFWSSNRTFYPVDEVLNICEAHGVTVEEVLKGIHPTGFSAANITAATKGQKELKKALKPVRQTTKTARFGWKKGK